jgi:hypothetical protein
MHSPKKKTALGPRYALPVDRQVITLILPLLSYISQINVSPYTGQFTLSRWKPAMGPVDDKKIEGTAC